jgi:hypothetical protein
MGAESLLFIGFAVLSVFAIPTKRGNFDSFPEKYTAAFQ